MTTDQKILRALQKRMRVTRKTAIQRGWAENLTASIASLRKRGYEIETVTEGESYTRYRLNEA